MMFETRHTRVLFFEATKSRQTVLSTDPLSPIETRGGLFTRASEQTPVKCLDRGALEVYSRSISTATHIKPVMRHNGKGPEAPCVCSVTLCCICVFQKLIQTKYFSRSTNVVFIVCLCFRFVGVSFCLLIVPPPAVEAGGRPT